LSDIITGFERLSDFVRSTFVSRISEFFSAQDGFLRAVVSEVPNIEKYEITENQERFSSSVHIQRYFADLFEKLPLIAITTTGARQAFNQVGIQEFMNEYNPVVISSLDAPYTLADQDDLVVKINGVEYTIIFESIMFDDITDVSIKEFKDVVDQLLIFLRSYDVEGKLALRDVYSRPLEIVGGSAVTKLGFTSGQTPANTFIKYSLISESMEAVVDIVTSDRNQRVEIMDLLSSLFGFYVFDRYLGQWLEEEGFIFFTTNYSRRGESETFLDNAPVEKLYFDTLSIPVRAFVQIDREENFEELNISKEGIIL